MLKLSVYRFFTQDHCTNVEVSGIEKTYEEIVNDEIKKRTSMTIYCSNVKIDIILCPNNSDKISLSLFALIAIIAPHILN